MPLQRPSLAVRLPWERMKDPVEYVDPDRAAADAEVVQQLWTTWAARGAKLSTAQWARPTRLSGWTVRDLYAHAAPEPDELINFLSTRAEGPPSVTTGAAILRAFNRPDGVAHVAASDIADAAAATAARVSTDDLVARFRAVTEPAFVARLRAIPPGQVVPHPVLGTVTVAALVEVSVMEHTVHLLDLIDAVGGAPAPEAAVQRALDIVAAVPAPEHLLETLTGRAPGTNLPVVR